MLPVKEMIRRNNCFLLLVMPFLFLLGSCGQGGKPYQASSMMTFDLAACEDTVSGTCVEFDSLTAPVGLECVDSFVVVLGQRKEALFTVMNARTDSLVAQFGRIGHAKDELLDAPDMCQFVEEADGSVLMCVQDYGASIIKVFDFTKSLQQRRLCYERRVKYDVDFAKVVYYRAFLLPTDGYLIHEGISTDGDARDDFDVPPCVSVMTRDGVQKISAHTSVIDSGGQDFVDRMYSMLPRMKPDMTKLVEVCAYVNLFTIVDWAAGSTLGVQGAGAYGFDDCERMAKAESADELYNHIFVQNVAFNVTDNYILVCQDGQTPVSDYARYSSYTPHVRIFDWGGQLLTSFCVRESLMRIAYNEETRMLYGLDAQGNLYRYDLSKYVENNE